MFHAAPPDRRVAAGPGAADSIGAVSAEAAFGADFRAVFRAALPSTGLGLRLHERVAILLVELSEWHGWLPAAATLIDSEQAERVRRRRQLAQRQELTLAYALHRLALAEALRQDPARVPLMRDPRGRPWIEGSELQTSLSHGSGFLALAVTAAGPVGVDIEGLARATEMPEIATMVCHRSEAEMLWGEQASVGARLLELWVRKEALLKAAGVGLGRPMTDFAAPPDVPLPLSPATTQMTRVQMLDARPHCVAAVAGPPGIAVECGWLRPREKIRGLD